MKSNLSPKAVWQTAERHLNREVYCLSVPAAREAWVRDRDWFARNPTEAVRIRRVWPQECNTAGLMAQVAPDAAVYAVVLHHERLQDMRLEIGVGLALVLTETGPEMAEGLRDEARRLMAWFQAFSCDPDDGEFVNPTLGIGVVHAHEGDTL